MQFYVAAAVADRGIGPADYPAERIDTVAGSIFCNVISIFIIIATAAAIKVRAPLDSAKQAAEALGPVAGRASALAAAVVPLSTAYAISEATGTERSVSKSFREAPLFLGLFTGQVFIGAGIALVPGNLIQLLVQAQILNGVITPVLLTYCWSWPTGGACSARPPTAGSSGSWPPSASSASPCSPRPCWSPLSWATSDSPDTLGQAIRAAALEEAGRPPCHAALRG